MKILIIGSKGFIGTYALKFFSEKNEVWGCDVVVDYAAKNYFLIDASNSDFEDVFSTIKFDVCINCSGSASVPDSFKNPSRDYFLNVTNVFRILEAIRKYNLNCKFLNLSSAAVYGNPTVLPIMEDHSLQPISPYGWHKYQSELLCREYHLVFGVQTCSARIFSAFGPSLKKQIFWDLYQKIIRNSNIEILGTGIETRDYIYIDDLMLAVNCIIEHAQFKGESVNVANGKGIAIKDLVRILQKKSPIPFDYTFTNTTRTGDPINWEADISKLKQMGYQQKISFEKGVEEILKWLSEEKK
jgi:UDP-glucose 4-epimerase